ncbi:hypothetical protein [Streptomyces sp. DH24]|uniref:hypothetical protein n=1 Tax=Streptomyces sp. DH24 TaxID=3040123 RepID=UPI00244181F4|nr:hypothetical protein [Streptomyces sp. DH24]MDG9716362.1 hypothetical protein [Streptomyces sp. DH24]
MASTTAARRAALVALTVVTVLTTAGCGGDSGEPDREAAAGTPSTGATGSAPARTKPTPTLTPTPTPTITAADGTDPAACADANCEIAVTEPVTFRFAGPDGRAATLSVTKVGRNEVEYTVKSGNGRSRGGASGPGQGCLTVLRGNGSGNSCGGGLDDTRPSPQPGAVVIQVTGHEDGTALLHIVSD